MNIEKMEKSAKDFVDKPTALNHTKFIQSSNPAAILELIERVRELENALIVTFAAVTDWADNGIGPDPELDSQMLQTKALINMEPK